MIHPLKIQILLNKTQIGFISGKKVSEILNVDIKTALEILPYLENMGYIEKAMDGLYQHSIRAKIEAIKNHKKEFRVETLKRNLDNLVERMNTVNSSAEYPHYVDCAIITTG